jgi:coenzyme F420-reducing hydrogenase gamma subunit
MASKKPLVAVHKFTSCDGCQLTILDCEEVFADLVDAVDIVYFMEAKSDFGPGPFDISFAEGSISTEEEIERIKLIRASSQTLVALGVCATAGGIQGLRNYGDFDKMMRAVYPHPEDVRALPKSLPYSDFVKVDYALQGCPIDRWQFVTVLTSLLAGKAPMLETGSVCLECKRKGNVCVLVANNMPCMGPVTHNGCGALCPSYGRDCYACFGPMDAPNSTRLAREFALRGFPHDEVERRYRKITSWAKSFREGLAKYESETHQR